MFQKVKRVISSFCSSRKRFDPVTPLLILKERQELQERTSNPALMFPVTLSCLPKYTLTRFWWMFLIQLKTGTYVQYCTVAYETKLSLPYRRWGALRRRCRAPCRWCWAWPSLSPERRVRGWRWGAPSSPPWCSPCWCSRPPRLQKGPKKKGLNR